MGVFSEQTSLDAMSRRLDRWPFAVDVFSLNDEDGILLEILLRLEISEPSVFREFGIDDVTECNTIILLAFGWRGVWVSGGTLAFHLPKEKVRLKLCDGGLRVWAWGGASGEA